VGVRDWVGVSVLVGVSVGWRKAVWVRPAAKVLTASVWIGAASIVAVGSGEPAPQAVRDRMTTSARTINKAGEMFLFIFSFLFGR
jgi:hypothetical protein